jgi:mono/diheme cytochrome c family protein
MLQSRCFNEDTPVKLLSAAACLGLLLSAVQANAEEPDPEILALYKTKCQSCHLADGNSQVPAMNFANGEWKHGTTVAELSKVIAEGVPGTAMLPFKAQLSEEEMEGLARYVRTFDKKLKPDKPAKGKKK